MGWVSDSKLVRWYRARSWLGRRVVLVALTLLAGWIVTAVTIVILLKWEVTTGHAIVLGALEAWTGELIFFSVLGGVVTVLTLKDPSQASFEERVRILYGAENLPEAVTEYNKRMVSHLAGYAHQAVRHVALEEYKADIKAYRAKVKTEYHYRNLLADVDYAATLPWRFRPDKISVEPPLELGRIISIKIGGQEKVTQPIIVDEKGFFTELPLMMSRKGETTVVFEYSTWMATGQAQTLHPRRFVEKFSMTIVNQCTQEPAVILIEGQPGPIQLLYNQNFSFKSIQSVAPEEKIFVFSLLPSQ